jgi:hypothetical protein
MEPIILKIDSQPAQEFFVPDHLQSTEDPISLFDGRYTLTVENYSTKAGSWNYTRGLVKDATGTLVADVQRNYLNFLAVPLSANDRDLLVVGTSYMVPTLIDLTRRKSYQIDNEELCWANAYLSPDGHTLVADCCIWGGGYFYTFWDSSVIFTDAVEPLIKELKVEGECPESDGSELEWIDNTTLKVSNYMPWYPTLQMRGPQASTYFSAGSRIGSDDSEARIKRRIELEELHPAENMLDSILTYKLDGLKMVQVDHWKSQSSIDQSIKEKLTKN